MPRDEALIRQLYVKVSGTHLDTAVMNDLYAVEVDTNLHLPDMCELRLHDLNAELTNDGPFDLGAELQVGVSDEQGRGDHTLFSGEITGLEPSFGEGMVVDLSVRAYDLSHRLHRGVHTKAYANMSDSDIASRIAQSVGLRADVDPSSPAHEHVYQDGQSHMAFLRERARRIGYEFCVRDRTLYFKRAGSLSQDRVGLEWGVQLRSFRPILTLGEQVSEVTVKGWDPGTKREVVGQAASGQAAPRIGEPSSGAQLAEDAFGAASDLAVRTVVGSQDEADSLAQALLDLHDGAFVEAEGMCYGVPDLKAGCTVEISSLGQRFNGRYQVTSATHIWDTRGDYVTRFRVSGRRSDTMRELLIGEFSPSPWQAMIGVVTNNSDPEDMGRVKVKFPWLDGQIESAWARVLGSGAGDGRGWYCLPEVNDEVLVIFEQGDIARPLIVGGLWSGVDAPPAGIQQVVVNGKVVQRLFVTRAGHRVTFSDENSAMIRIESAGGHSVLIDDDAAKIEITTAGGNTLVLDDNGQALRIEGAGQISIEASQNLDIKSQGNMNIEATGNVTIKGALVQLNP